MSPAAPAASDPVAKWLRARNVMVLRAEGDVTLGHLVEFIERRSAGWWRGAPAWV